MNSLTYSKKLLHLASVCILLVSACAAKAQILLTINDTDPNNVIITATGNASSGTASDLMNNGIDLLTFFTSSTGTFLDTAAPNSNLTTPTLQVTGPFYNDTVVDFLSPGQVDLTLYSTDHTAVETFAPGLTAFSGTMDVDLAALSTFLPATGSSGIIVSGSSASGSNPEIGSWQVISAPEPSSWMLLAMALAGFAIFRVRLAKAKSRA